MTHFPSPSQVGSSSDAMLKFIIMITRTEKSLGDVRRQFVDEDAAEAKRAVQGIYTVSARTFLITGLEIEERQ